jgi:hypothetical protein
MSDEQKKQEQQQPTAAPPDADAGYETRDASSRGIAIGMVIGVIVIVISIIGVREFYITTREQIRQENVLSRMDPRLRELQNRETRILTSYEWVDSTKGIVRIPVERAMELMVEEAYRERQSGR